MRISPSPFRGAFLARLLIAAGLVVGLSAASLGSAYWWVNQKVDEIAEAEIDEAVFDEPPSGEGKAANFLIVGSDTREFVRTDDDVRRFGDPERETGRRSDTLMIAHLDPASGTSLLVSFPRDLWVEIPGLGGSRINAAYGQGPQKVVETIQHNFDVPVHHYLEVDFVGFRGIVDAIGSVPIFFPAPARDDESGLHIPLGGCVALNGDQALDYARSRYYEWYDVERGVWRADPTSDLGRIRRQQYFLRSLAQAAIDKAGRNPVRAYRLLDEVVKHLVKDEALGLSDLRALAHVFRDVDPASLEMVTLPTERVFHGRADVQEPIDEQAAPILERLRFREPEPPTGAPPATAGVPTTTTTLPPNPGTLPGITSTRDPDRDLPWVGCEGVSGAAPR